MWRIYRDAVPRSEVFVDQPENFVDTLLLHEMETETSRLTTSLRISELELCPCSLLHFWRQVSLFPKTRSHQILKWDFFHTTNHHKQVFPIKLFAAGFSKASPDVPCESLVSKTGRWKKSRLGIPQGLGIHTGLLGTCDNLELQTDSTS